VDLIIFDCDGVLVDSEIIAYHVLVRELGARLPGVDVERLVRDTTGMTTESILELVERGARRPLPPGTLAVLERATDRALDAELRPLPGVVAALAAIPGLKAVASNSSLARVQSSLDRAELTQIFGERVFSADMVAAPKPRPDIYLHAAEQVGVPPTHCLAVEDSVPGVTAARMAGMAVIGFTGASHVPVNQADRLRLVGAAVAIDHMDLLPGLVSEWSQRHSAAG
jgi:HAD superfamily hydrolase (TIGR01509 family)